MSRVLEHFILVFPGFVWRYVIIASRGRRVGKAISDRSRYTLIWFRHLLICSRSVLNFPGEPGSHREVALSRTNALGVFDLSSPCGHRETLKEG